MQPPKIDTRDMQALLKQFRELAPYYTPEWRLSLDDPDPGTAMLHIVGDMLHKTIDRLNRVPMKHFIAFLNMLDVSLLPAHPAYAYLRFHLVEGAREPILVPAGTKVAAEPEGTTEPVIFETEHPLLVTPASLSATYQVSTEQDVIRKVETYPASLFRFGEGENLQSHCLYLAHPDLFELRHAARIELALGHSKKQFTEEETCRKLADPRHARWEFLTREGWRPFARVEQDRNRLVLYKSGEDAIAESEIRGMENRWIQCRIRPGDRFDDYLNPGRMELTDLKVKTEYWDEDQSGGFPPDQMFFDDMELDPEAFLPFGEYFAPYGCFYLSSREAFSKKRSRVCLKFRLTSDPRRLLPEEEEEIDWKMIMKKSQFEKKDPPEVSILRVLWEYWDGQGWVRLFSDRKYERIFYRPTEEGENHEIRFQIPDDLQETFVNSQHSYWIRARIVSIENLYAVDTLYLTPRMEQVRLTYGYADDEHFLPEQCWTLNNLEYRDRTNQMVFARDPFPLFYSWDTRKPAYYFGFEQPPLKGPVSLYFSIRSPREKQSQNPVVEWQYLAGTPEGNRWTPLRTEDETDHFTRSGTIRFAGPPDLAGAPLFGQDLYWIRAVNLNGIWDKETENSGSPSVIESIHINCIRAVQQETISEEIPELLAESMQRTYGLAKSPMTDEEVWVDETGYVTEEHIEELQKKGVPLEVIRDSDRRLQRVWVRWSPVDRLYDSGPDDRHYMIDRTNGTLRFGDGVQGRALPNTGTDKIKVNYKFVGGKSGNVEAGEINRLQQTIAFIQGVDNPEPAGGGCDMEALEEAMHRGPQVLKHRNRAVTTSDFEWLAREAYPNIAKVKCLPNFNARMEKEPGAITLAVLSREGAGHALFFSELQKEVHRYIMERAACTVAFDGQIHVVEAAGLEISVYARLAVDSMERVVSAEREAVSLLNRFLDPYGGNHDGGGWDIGEAVHASMFFGLLKSVPGVNHVEKISMTVHLFENGERRELKDSELADYPHGIVMNGHHRVVVDVIEEET